MVVALEPVNVGALRVHFVAAAGVDDHRLVFAADDERAETERDAITFVWRQAHFPQRARYHTEHCAAVETKEAVGERNQLEVAERMAHRSAKPGDLRRRLLQFDEHAVGGRRMDERHQRVFRAWPRLLIHQPHTFRLELRQRRLDVVDAKRDVVDAGAASLHISRDRRIRGRCLEQLQRRLSQRDEVSANTLRRHFFRRFDIQTQCVAIERQRLVEVGDGNADVIEPRFH